MLEGSAAARPSVTRLRRAPHPRDNPLLRGDGEDLAQHATMESAIAREKRGRMWLRRWKLELIKRDNLGWCDLAEDLGFPPLEATGFPLSRG